MKLWLDDVRPAPGPDWVHATTAWAAVRALADALSEGERIEAISLDHDLGADPKDGIYAKGTSEETGMIVADYLADDVPPVLIECPVIIHSWNMVAAQRMCNRLRPMYTVHKQPYQVPA